MLRDCEEFLRSLFCPGEVHIEEVKKVGCFLFKKLGDEQGVDKLPSTQGAWIEHMRSAHVHDNNYMAPCSHTESPSQMCMFDKRHFDYNLLLFTPFLTV